MTDADDASDGTADDRPECRAPWCDDPARVDAPTAFASRFCSPECEVRFEHLRADARDARTTDDAGEAGDADNVEAPADRNGDRNAEGVGRMAPDDVAESSGRDAGPEVATATLRHSIYREIDLLTGPPGTCDHRLDAVFYERDGTVFYTDFGVVVPVADRDPGARAGTRADGG